MREQTDTAAAAVPHRYTAAFEELGLAWDWDPATYGSGREGLSAYLRKEHPHLLRAYEAEFLVDAVESTCDRLARAR